MLELGSVDLTGREDVSVNGAVLGYPHGLLKEETMRAWISSSWGSSSAHRCAIDPRGCGADGILSGNGSPAGGAVRIPQLESGRGDVLWGVVAGAQR